jgi:DedD protein
MAFFKLRKAAGEQNAPAPAPESVDALRKRARYRLAGAAILVLAGVVGFPLLFDNQPRPIAVDIPIDIPDKAKVKPLAASSSASEARKAELASLAAQTQAVVKEARPVARERQKEEFFLPTPKPAARLADKATEKPAEKPAATGRFIVQFGSYTESARAQEARLKVEKAGLKTYAQVADSADGKKYRVRVGPFEKRSDAEKAAEKIKKLDLPASILGL